MNPCFFGVIVTYRRPALLALSLKTIMSQDLVLERLVVVDCDPRGSAEAIVRGLGYSEVELDYLPLGENKGPAGGRAAGLQRVVATGAAESWVVLFDDDDPLPDPTLLSDLSALVAVSLEADPSTAGVGLRGAHFDVRRARAIPVVDFSTELASVDHLHGGFFPIYRLEAVEQVGGFAEELFYGFEELELGLRLSAAGFSLYMAASIYERLRGSTGHPEPLPRPRIRSIAPTWRRYYALRNLIHILLRITESPLVALRVAVVRGIMKPLVNLPLLPSQSVATLRLNIRAIRDALAGRLGKTMEPDEI